MDDSYYEAVARLGELAEKNAASLTLMGIQPTYPSEKYGYIIPENKDKVSGVKEFKEKPDKETAQKYLDQGAVWNAGVFAFKLGYLVEKAHSMLDFKDYRDLYAKYSQCPKISFDYAVVEKESSIQMMRYAGYWKDVGTWNTMSEVMANPIKGNAVIDETCENVNIVNELDIPILVMGEKNMVVAASGDGILVADKERSGYMKPYVEKISTEAKYIEKSWGSYNVLDAGEGYRLLKVKLNAGRRMSYHSHELRDESITILSGNGKTVIDGMEQIVRPGDIVTMAAGCKHTLIAETEIIALETQVGEEITFNDKKKFPLDSRFVEGSI